MKNKDNVGELVIFDKRENSEHVKRLNSDRVEVLASLAALEYDKKREIKNTISRFTDKYFKNNKIPLFNRNENVLKLVHEVGQVRLKFTPKIDPEHLKGVYFSDSTFDN